MKMTIFISQPMRGKTPEEIHAMRVAIKKLVVMAAARTVVELHTGFRIKFLKSYHPRWKTLPREKAMRKSLRVLRKANFAIFAPGWECSAGCKTEHDFCLAHGIEHFEMDNTNPAPFGYSVISKNT